MVRRGWNEIFKQRQTETVRCCSRRLPNEEAKYYGSVDTPEGSKDVSVDSIFLRILDKEGFSTSTENKDGLEGVISRIAGKNVSFARVLAGSLVFVVCLGLAGVFIVSAIKNSFISIGRNPLSSNSILKV